MRPEDVDRFFDKLTVVESGCWIWTAGIFSNGYGQFSLGGHRGRNLLSHRVSWEIHNGPIPEGMCVLHRCDQPSCCRPDHLFLGTQQDNVDDMIAKGRRADLRGEDNGSAKLTADKVQQIRARLAENRYTAREIGAMFGVSRGAVEHIKYGTRWGWLLDEEQAA